MCGGQIRDPTRGQGGRVVVNGLLVEYSIRTKYLQVLQDIGSFVRIGFSVQIGGLVKVDCSP